MRCKLIYTYSIYTPILFRKVLLIKEQFFFSPYLLLQVFKGCQQLLFPPCKFSIGVTLLAQPIDPISDISQHPLHTSDLGTAIKAYMLSITITFICVVIRGKSSNTQTKYKFMTSIPSRLLRSNEGC